MPDAALPRTDRFATFETFLAWAQGRDRHYELVDGLPVEIPMNTGLHQLIVEVESPSNGSREIAERRADHARLPTLVELLEVGAEAPEVRVWRRAGDGLILAARVTDLEGAVTVSALAAELPLRELYRDVAVA